MINFAKQHLKFSIFIFYFILGLIILLPTIFLINQNLALNLDIFSFNAKYFEVIKLFQNLNSQNIIEAIYDIFSPLSIGYLFHLILSEPLGFNLFLLFFFPFGAFAGYLLINYFTNQENKIISIFCGLLFGIVSIVCYPLILILYFIYFLLKSLENLNIKLGLIAALFYLFICSYSLFFAITTLLLSLIIIIFILYPKFKELIHQSQELTKLSSFLLLLIILFSLKYYWPLRQIQPFDLSSQLFISNSLDIYNLLQISLMPTIFLVIVIVFLILLFTILALKFCQTNKWIIFSFITSIIFIIFSFGPCLIFQQNIISPKINLPYLFLYYFFPFFNQTIDLKSFLIFSLIFFLIFISFGLKFFFEKIKISDKLKKINLSLIFLLILFGSWSIWQPGPKISNFYKNLSKQDSIVYLNAPSSKSGNFIYQNSENKNNIILSQNISNDNFEITNSKTPVQSFIDNLPQNREINYANFIQPDYEKTFSQYLADDKIKYIIFDSNYINKAKPQSIKIDENTFEIKKFQELLVFNKIINFLKSNTQGKWQVVGNNLVYEIIGPRIDQITIYQGQNWGETDYILTEQRKVAIKEHWMLNEATITIKNPTTDKKNIELYFSARTENELRKLEIYQENNKITDFIIGPQKKSYLVTIKDIESGSTNLTFRVSDYQNRKLEISEQNKKNSILFYNIRYTEITNEMSLDFLKNFNNENNTKILILPTEIDSLKNNDKFITFQDIMDKNNENVPNLPILNDLYFNNPDLKNKTDIFNKNYYYNTGQEILNRYNIGYIALYKSWLNEKEFSDLMEFIIANCQIDSVIFDNNNLVIFKLKNQEATQPIKLDFNGSWQPNVYEMNTARLYNIAVNNAGISLINPEENNVNANLQFKVTNFLTPSRTIKVYLNEDWLDKKALTEIKIPQMNIGQEKNIRIPLENLRSGENEIMLEIFNENNETLKGNEKGVRLFDFSIETKDISKEPVFQQIEYCSNNYKPVFDNYSFKKEFTDNFEDEDFTRANWNLDWQMRFTETEHYNSRQSLTYLNIGSGVKFAKPIYDCANKINASIMLKATKWDPYIDLYFNFVKNSDYNINLLVPPPSFFNFTLKSYINLLTPNKGLYVNKENQSIKFDHNLPINQWNKIEIEWQKSGNFKLFENDELVLDKNDYDTITPDGVQILLTGDNFNYNIKAYFDDFNLKIE